MNWFGRIVSWLFVRINNFFFRFICFCFVFFVCSFIHWMHWSVDSWKTINIDECRGCHVDFTACFSRKGRRHYFFFFYFFVRLIFLMAVIKKKERQSSPFLRWGLACLRLEDEDVLVVGADMTWDPSKF